MAETFKRPLIAHFIDISQASSYSSANWARLGVNVTSASIEYGAQTETNQDIVSDTATTEVTGYQSSISVSQKCTKDDDVFEFVNTLRLNRATLSDAHTWAMNVDLWDTEDDTTYTAEVQEVSIGITSYGGEGGAVPTLEYTINYIGDPVMGTATVTDGVPTFTAA